MARHVHYRKPPLTLEAQADLLIGRGMSGDRDLMIERLSTVSYYRLSGYSFPFRNPDSETFRPGTTFEAVWRRYTFDRNLRLLVLDAIERIEVAARALLAHHHSLVHGPFAYAEDGTSLSFDSSDEREKFLEHLRQEKERSREQFVRHFNVRYGDPYLPVWMATEIMSFGTMLTFYRAARPTVKARVAEPFSVPELVFTSWLLTLNTVRNICAHHGRLWNRELGVKPKIPRREMHPAWHAPYKIPNNRVFGVLTLCRYCLDCISPRSGWAGRFDTLLDEYADVPLAAMGMPANWKVHAIWNESPAGAGDASS
jgi:abortive infection bacteriophage resistance protein